MLAIHKIKREDREYQCVLQQIIHIQHRELDRRYRIAALVEHEEIRRQRIEVLDENKTESLRNLFKLYLYPAEDVRLRRDDAFASLIRLLREPGKVISLFPAMPKIVWKIGRHFAKALGMGLESVIAFNLSLELERKIILRIIGRMRDENRPIRPGSVTFDDFAAAYRRNKYSEALRLYKLATHIFSSVQDLRLIAITQEILEFVQEQMKKSGKDFAASIQAIEFGHNVLDETIRIFRDFSKEEGQRLVQIVRIIERKYMDSLFLNKEFGPMYLEPLRGNPFHGEPRSV